MNTTHRKSGAISLAIVLLNLLSYAQQLTVINQDYTLAKTESVKQNKLLIIDFYTTWCVPCKELDEAVFKDTTVSKQFAGQFVVLRYDAEKDNVHRLTLKHHVSFYPTTVVLNPAQRVVNRLIGSSGTGEKMVPAYLDFLRKASANAAENKFIKGVSASTDLTYPRFYEDYVFRVNTKGVAAKVTDYWKSNSDYLSEVPFAILCYFQGATDEVNKFFLENKKKYADLYGELDVKFILTMMITAKLSDAIDAKDRSAFNAAVRLAKEHLDTGETKQYLLGMEEQMLQQEGRWTEALKSFSSRKNAQQVSDYETARLCRAASEKCSEISVLKPCAEWMKAIAGKTPEYDHLDTYARLLFKTGEKNKSYLIMKQAIAAGKLAKEDVTGSEKWLNQFNSDQRNK
ncbi:thioredoxin family protein [Hufsiella ginkgonis]|uniref:Thioredoxin domain-containing protein n=1 Tax=Hufsiella ginkgonis TaxID=2695274 RepID=A0A7K1Y089_9SPHI|nr:thioredoxin family protein [Hufsiella ginkgonis]MXV16487.1 hypothetical protein [Hufsiella ginkgonis]